MKILLVSPRTPDTFWSFRHALRFVSRKAAMPPLGLLTVAAMVVMRDLLRNLALAPYFSPNQLPVAPQWGIILLFVLMFVAGLATLYYMLRKVAIATGMQGAAAQKLK